MRSALHVIATIVIMLAVSRMIVRIVDATVRIDDDLWVLLILLVMVNCLIGFSGRKIYKMMKKQKGR